MSNARFRTDVDYYEVLQVHPSAHPAVIRKVYHVLMLELKHHPDLGGDVERAQLINEAFAVLSDPQRRQEYDRFRAEVGLRTESPGAARTAPEQGADPDVHAALLEQIQEAMTALSAWPPRKTPPPFCRGRAAGVEVGPLSRVHGFRYTGSIRSAQEKLGEELEFRTYARPSGDLRMVVVAARGTLVAGMLCGAPEQLAPDVVRAFAAEVTGGEVDVEAVARLLHAVEYLDSGDRRRRTRALDLWLACATREPHQSCLVLSAYPL
ncbi:MAG: J domain-containing protein [Armatimonadota bacterium]|nr:J domain-containing protein [Armatimonadota bacterium]MDR5675604.1 J domain-containing protein [Armatimonadota bacterium]MDR5689807.1 J domain-containing protein [Armatimonadota bacterium]MDR7386038.1 J domain-containing protein [Armatimonadota bacterium]MDR7389324.1 J domain-containing protein [Armatimonadota bacterium]